MVQEISAEEFVELYKTQKGVILDVRTQSEYDGGHLQGSRKADIVSDEFMQVAKELDPNETYYLYCRSGGRSGRAAGFLANNGFEKVYNIGGFEDLDAAGFPVDYK